TAHLTQEPPPAPSLAAGRRRGADPYLATPETDSLTGRPPPPVGAAGRSRMIVEVDLGSRSYRIVVESGALQSVGRRLRGLPVGTRAALVSDGAVMRLHGKAVVASLESAGFAVATIEVPEGEAAKTLAVAQHCWDELLAAGLDRTSTVLALGGG